MIKYAVLVSVLFLAACYEPTPEQQQKLKQSLPEGCTVIEVGQYGSIDSLIIIECEGRRVTASYTYMHQQNGKTSETDRSAVYVIQ